MRKHPYRPAGPKPPRLHHFIAMGLEYLRAEGTDPLDAWAAYLRPRSVKFVAEMRMSDTHLHSLEPGDPLVSQFSMDHPEYVIRRADGITPVALDYAIEAVRHHRFAILREIAERDVDGLSLNFMRWAKHFERDTAREQVPIMTGFVGNESFNGKLRDELLNAEIFDTLLEAKVLIERWRRYYNTVRPHSSLGYRPPAPEAIQPWPADSGATPPACRPCLSRSKR